MGRVWALADCCSGVFDDRWHCLFDDCWQCLFDAD